VIILARNSKLCEPPSHEFLTSLAAVQTAFKKAAILTRLMPFSDWFEFVTWPSKAKTSCLSCWPRHGPVKFCYMWYPIICGKLENNFSSVIKVLYGIRRICTWEMENESSIERRKAWLGETQQQMKDMPWKEWMCCNWMTGMFHICTWFYFNLTNICNYFINLEFLVR
jgi:hypothetical protein